MNLNDTQRKMLTLFLGECWHEHGEYFTCDLVADCHNRTFTTWPDLGAVKEKLVELHLWHKFIVFSKTLFYFNDYDPVFDSIETGFYNWLFRPVDEKGEPHFCRLVAEFLEGRK